MNDQKQIFSLPLIIFCRAQVEQYENISLQRILGEGLESKVILTVNKS